MKDKEHINNCIRIALHHKKHCEGKHCEVCLYGLVELLDKAGIEMTDAERMHFV